MFVAPPVPDLWEWVCRFAALTYLERKASRKAEKVSIWVVQLHQPFPRPVGNYNETPFGQALLALRRLVFVMARIGIRAKIGVGYGYKKGGLASIGLPYRGRVKIGEEIQFFRGVK